MNCEEVVNSEATSDLDDLRQHPRSAPDDNLALKTVSYLHIEKLIRQSPPKSSIIDPIPTKLLKSCLSAAAPVIASIVNSSITHSLVPEILKSASVTPIFKKRNNDPESLASYRPINNLPFLAKILEKVVAHQPSHHMSQNHLDEPYQSAYRKFHGTETALTRIQNDILLSMDQGKVAILVLLDLSAAFDALDHQILLERLQSHVGVSLDTACWFKSYLAGRTQTVNIITDSETGSSSYPLRYGVPQGSVLGPLLFNIYMLPIGQVIRNHGLTCHFYADDTVLYVSASPTSDGVTMCTSLIERCCTDIKRWMNSNYMKLNTNKTELLVIGTPGHLNKVPAFNVNIGDDCVEVSKQIKNLGVVFDRNMNMQTHIREVARNAMYHLHNISKI